MKYLFFFVVGVLLMDVLWAQEEDDPCSLDPTETCRPEGLEPFENMMPSVDYLDRHCDAFLRGFQCLADYEIKCLPENLTIFGRGTKAADVVSVVSDICDKNTSFGKAYREHVDCVNSFGLNITKTCFEDNMIIESKYMIYLAREYGMTEEDPERIDCMFVKMKKKCLRGSVQKYCGPEASTTVQEMLNRIMVPSLKCVPEHLTGHEERFALFSEQQSLSGNSTYSYEK